MEFGTLRKECNDKIQAGLDKIPESKYTGLGNSATTGILYSSRDMITVSSYEARYRGGGYRHHPIEIWKNFNESIEKVPISQTEKISLNST